ncbi:MAG: ParB/RepB/Spo0J family partition protein [Rhizobiaceae bacterium]|nr:ParB/RepB/Spo0J family partition protein [Rhizobiaceae bacterium]
MADEPSKARLGRGLAALIGEMDKPVAAGAAEAGESTETKIVTDRVVPIETIRANPNNPRRHFSEEDLEDLSRSIAEHGVIQPILVRSARPSQDPDNIVDYEIIAGERRWRAAQRAGIHSVPILLREVDDRQALELAIIENVQRADLDPVEEALGYRQLMDDHDYRQADLGKVIGKSRSHVANTLRLLNLPASVQAMLSSGTLSSGHARALIPMESPEALAKRIVAEGLSVRQVEQLAAQNTRSSKSTEGESGKSAKDADTMALENRLTDALGLKVSINHKSSGKGRVTIDYKSLDQLDALTGKLASD